MRGSSCSAAARVAQLRQPRSLHHAAYQGRHELHVSGHEAVIRMDQLPGTAVRTCLLEDRMEAEVKGVLSGPATSSCLGARVIEGPGPEVGSGREKQSTVNSEDEGNSLSSPP